MSSSSNLSIQKRLAASVAGVGKRKSECQKLGENGSAEVEIDGESFQEGGNRHRARPRERHRPPRERRVRRKLGGGGAGLFSHEVLRLLI